MKKIIKIIGLITAVAQPIAYAQETIIVPVNAMPSYNPYYVPLDLLISRPLGLAATVAGTIFFVGASPFIALTTIAPPHDSFQRTADALIVVPATYTFLRPIGQFLCPGACRPADIEAAAQYAPYQGNDAYRQYTPANQYDGPDPYSQPYYR